MSFPYPPFTTSETVLNMLEPPHIGDDFGEDDKIAEALVKTIVGDMDLDDTPKESIIQRNAREYAYFAIFSDTVKIFNNNFLHHIAFNSLRYEPAKAALFIKMFKKEIKRLQKKIRKRK